MPTTTSASDWNFYNYHVQQELQGGQFVSAESTLVAAGPPSLTSGDGGTATVYPMGLLETVGLQQSRQLQRIFEIGSSRSYFIPGRTVGSISIGRTFYYGPSLLRVMYAYYPTEKLNNGSIYRGLLEPPTNEELHKVTRIPGYKDFLIDLSSDLFAQPTGMALYFKDANANSVGAFYLEQVYVQSHQMTVSSGSVLIMEGASMQYDIITPINISDSADTGIKD